MGECIAYAPQGSSPRMRGTLGLRLDLRNKIGIIPAHAGNTEGGMPLMLALRDHPRACGEHRTSYLAPDTNQGSSPRMRGTLCHRFAIVLPCGIIPAHAGNTCRQRRRVRCTWDHPRACGEHMSSSSGVNACSGSSPRMRGTPVKRLRGQRLRGIIPAHAGNTMQQISGMADYWDHPRACGEHMPLARPKDHARGSSPRMRGTQNL